MRFNQSFGKSGFTMIELMLVVAIVGVLASIAMPRFDLMAQKAWQASSKANLGAIRSTLNLYYTDNEGVFPMNGYPNGYLNSSDSLSLVLVPRYIAKIPTPKLLDRLGTFNNLSLSYDVEAANWMSQSPPADVVILSGPAGPTPNVNRPFVYDPQNGLIYICNGNFDVVGVPFWQW